MGSTFLACRGAKRKHGGHLWEPWPSSELRGCKLCIKCWLAITHDRRMAWPALKAQGLGTFESAKIKNNMKTMGWECLGLCLHIVVGLCSHPDMVSPIYGERALHAQRAISQRTKTQHPYKVQNYQTLHKGMSELWANIDKSTIVCINSERPTSTKSHYTNIVHTHTHLDFASFDLQAKIS